MHTVTLIGVALAISAVSESTDSAFLLLVGNIHSTDPWRFVTAHFAHTDQTHLLLNLLALAVLGSLLEQHSRNTLWLTLASGMLAVNLWFYRQTEIILYCGLSGALCALMIVALSRSQNPRFPCWHQGSGNLLITLILVAFIAKLGIELLTPARLVATASWPSATQAHVAGALAGAAVTLTTRNAGTLRRNKVAPAP